jgi:hypothetical protein
MRAFFALFIGHSLGRELIQWSRHDRGLRLRFRYDFFFYWTIHSQFSLVRSIGSFLLPGYVCSTTFASACLPWRSWSAVKTCPQVLQRHFEVALPGLLAPGVKRAFSLGLNAIASSPPHPRQSRFRTLS